MKIWTRNGGIAGMLAGLGYLAQAAIVLVPQTAALSGRLVFIVEIVFLLTLLATIFGLIGLHSLAQNQKAATLGIWLAIVGTGLMALSTLAAYFGDEYLPTYGFVAGIGLAWIGYTLLGMTALRGRLLPFWIGLALILGFPLSMLLSPQGGGILFGLAWLGLGYFLLKQQPESAAA